MIKMELKNQYFLLNITAILIALSLFVVGRFGFADILGLKRILEFLLFLPIVLLGVFLVLQVPKVWINPFCLLPFTYFIFQFLHFPNAFELADYSLAALTVATIFSLGAFFADLLLRYVIKISTFFAVLGIIEFIILLLEPSLVRYILLFYDTYSGSTVPVIQNLMQLLGLSDGTFYHLWGLSVTRLRSFASEPSLLVGYFLVPGALGLTYGGKYAFYGMICITFCLCSLAGSVFVSICFGLLSLSLFVFRSQRFTYIFPFLIYALFVWALFNYFNDMLLVSKNTGQSYDFLDKSNSANIRFGYIRDFFPKILTSPFGVDELICTPLGFIMRSFANSGIFGASLASIVLIKLYKSIGCLLVDNKLGWIRNLGLLIVYGSLITGLLFLDNCFIQIYGFTLITLIYLRTKTLSFFIQTNVNMEEKTLEAD